MKTIKVFLASSDELTDDRIAFGNLVRRLDEIYERRGIRIKLFEWEDYDAAYNCRRKQDEYNDKIKSSDMFLALFHTKAGQFTIEEFDVATEEFRKHASPKVYAYCKDLQTGERESPELTEFKRRLFEEMGHYWCRYNNRDSMQLHFVMQLQLVETSGQVEKLKIKENTIVLEGIPIAKMDQLQFAAGNKAYQRMSMELAELPEKIEKARQRLEKFPDDEDLKDDLQQKLNRYNQLKNEFEQLQQALFETAQRITAMQEERVSDLLRRAIDAFSEGNLERANALLDEVAHEADRHIAQLDSDRMLVHRDIEAFQLQAKTVMADVSIPINDRIQRVAAIYAKADDWAERSALPKEKYESLLVDYVTFLSKNAFYDRAMTINQRLLSLREALYGKDHHTIATTYNNIGWIHERLGSYYEALEYHYKAMAIRLRLFGTDNPATAQSLNNIGMVYLAQSRYAEALENLRNALSIRKETLTDTHPDIAQSYNNIGFAYYQQGKYSEALEYYSEALVIQKKIFGEEHEAVALSYNNIGAAYINKGDGVKALEFYMKALAIREKLLGTEHPDIAASHNNIGMVLYNQGLSDKALEHYLKALSIWRKTLGPEHPNISTSYNNIGMVYCRQANYSKATEYFLKALAIQVKVFGNEHPDVAQSYNNIGTIYANQGDYPKALEYLNKALAIYEKFLGADHPNTKGVKANIDFVKGKIES